MRTTILLPLLATPAFADYTSDLVGVLNGLGLTSLVAAIQNASQTDGGKTLISTLSNTTNNFTVFAPNNRAFSNAPSNATSPTESDPGLLNTLKYHVVAGSLATSTSGFPKTIVGHTYLDAPNVVMLEGNKTQAVALTTFNDTTYVMNQKAPTKVVNSTTWKNLELIVIDSVIEIPGDLSYALDYNWITEWENYLKKISLWTDLNDDARGFTFFAPNTATCGNPELQHTLEGLNQSTLTSVLGNHIIKGATLYSSDLASGAGTISGQNISVATNSSGIFITAGHSTARVVTPDVILKNGVMHVVDEVLFNYTAFFPDIAGGSKAGGNNGVRSLSFSHTAMVTSVVGAVVGGMLML